MYEETPRSQTADKAWTAPAMGSLRSGDAGPLRTIFSSLRDYLRKVTTDFRADIDANTTSIANINKLTTKGDLLSRTSTAYERLAVGATNNHMLVVDSSTATGLRWHGGYTAFTPTLTATTTNPTLGTGSAAEGRWVRYGNTVHYYFQITFGTSGVAAGSGGYRISLPVNADTTAGAAQFGQQGTAQLYDASALAFRIATTSIVTSTTLLLVHESSAVAGTTNASPWTWAASDQIRGFIIYQAA